LAACIVEDAMLTALKLLSLPFLFILPWLLMKVSDKETFVQQTLLDQPLLMGVLLLPGLVLSIGWILRGLRK
jgi:hypothetical protein